MNQLAENIKRLRKEKKWSQTELARRIGANLSHMNRVENGKYVPSLATVIDLAKAFDVSVDYLVNRNNDTDEVRIEDKVFAEKIKLLNNLNEEERNIITKIIEAFLTKKKMLELLTRNEVTV